VQSGGRPMRSGTGPRPVPACPSAALVWLLGPLCLLAGCSFLPPSHPPPVFDLTPEGVAARVLAPVTLDQVDRPPPVDGPAPVAPLPRSPDVPPSPAAAAEAPGPPVFSLPQAVAFGLENNPRLLAARAAIERAQGLEDVAFAPFLPEIDFLSHGGVTSPALGPAPIGKTGIVLSTSTTETHSYAHAELQLQWTVWDFGRRSGRYRQAVSRERIVELQSARAGQTVGFDVAAAYLQVLRAAAIRRAQEDAIRAAEATLRDARSRRAAGVAERDDVLRAEVHLAAALEDLDVAREAELAGLARLNNALGRNAGLPLRVVGWTTEPALNLSLAQCLEVAAEQRPEVGVARQAVAAAQAGRQAAAAEFLPKVYALAAAGGITGGNVATGGQEGAGLHIDMPVFTGGKLRGELRAADAEVRQAVADARSILDGVTLQVTLAYLAATTARRRIERDRPAVAEARENLRLVRNRYRNGQATPTDIVDAETALTRAQQRLASATYEYLGALASLDYALGNPAEHLLGPPGHPERPAEAGPAEEAPVLLLPPRPLPRPK
jgi:outer membrane protein